MVVGDWEVVGVAPIRSGRYVVRGAERHACRSGDRRSKPLRDTETWPCATPPAGGGLCRLKPAFQAVVSLEGGGGCRLGRRRAASS